MSRPLRLEYPGAVLHITSRGNERRNIFLDDHDRQRFLHLLSQAVRRFKWIITAYVLMTNHIHMVLELTAANLSLGMQWLNGTYSQSFNRRYKRVGHLVEGPFKAVLVDESNYMFEVLRYVVLNSVRAKIVAHPHLYPWSSYRSTAGLAPVPDWLAVDNVLALFATDREIAQSRYRDFVQNGIGRDRAPWDDLVGQIYLGSEAWIESVRTKVEAKPRADAHPGAQRDVSRRAMAHVVTSVASALGMDEGWLRHGRGGTPRMIAAWLGCYEGRLSLTAIAAGLRLRSSGHVSTLIRRCDQQLANDASLRASVDLCTEALHLMWKSDESKL